MLSVVCQNQEIDYATTNEPKAMIDDTETVELQRQALIRKAAISSLLGGKDDEESHSEYEEDMEEEYRKDLLKAFKRHVDDGYFPFIILDNINNLDIAVELREMLKGLYACIKSNDAYLKFAILTGVSKFSKVSLFSGLNILDDIS